jgi:hypothetical protein
MMTARSQREPRTELCGRCKYCHRRQASMIRARENTCTYTYTSYHTHQISYDFVVYIHVFFSMEN